MDRRALGATPANLVLQMGIVATAGLDNITKDLRTSVAAAATRVDTDRTLFQQHKTSVERALAAEPVLFRAREAAFRDRLTKDGVCIAHESDQLAPLQQLVKANRRTDGWRVGVILSHGIAGISGALYDVEAAHGPHIGRLHATV